jgi:hypothetical protein
VRNDSPQFSHFHRRTLTDAFDPVRVVARIVSVPRWMSLLLHSGQRR